VRAAILAVALCGCSGAPSPTTAPPAKADVRTSRDAMVREVIALLDAGDVNGLLALADGRAAMALALDCKGNVNAERRVLKSEEKIALAAVRAKGSRLQVVDVDAGKTEVVKVGEQHRGCTVRTELTQERVKLKLRTNGDPAKGRVDLVKIGDRYYMLEAPRVDKQRPPNEAMGKFVAHIDRVCACPDMNCVTEATEAYGKEMGEWARVNAGRTAEAPTEDEMRMMEEATKRMTECTMRLAQQAQQNP
jgi:hypothetical protein